MRTLERLKATSPEARNRFQGRSIMVSGGAAGIGAAAVRSFAREKARVAILDRNAGAGTALAAELREQGADATFFYLDLNDTGAISRILDQIQAQFGTPDVLFSHAGVVSVAPIDGTTLDQLDDMLNINVRGTYLVCQHALRAMVEAGGGSIVITSSIGASHAFPLESVYCMTKAAVAMLAKSIATEFRDRGIRANAVCPGFVRTNHGLQEIGDFAALGISWDDEALRASQGRMCEPEEVAQAVLFLASDDASFINGTALYVDNGWAVKG